MAAAMRRKAYDPTASLDGGGLPFRQFTTEPTKLFVDQVAEHIKQTGQPETCDGLFRGQLDQDTRYRILRKINIDRRKRPEGDRATCPMCTPNRFLEGAIVYCHEIGVVAVIGHCCATHADEAQRDFRKAELKWSQETYLMAALPQLRGKQQALAKLRGAADAALALYRKFRLGAPRLHQHLRDVAVRGGRLVLYEVLRTADEDQGDRRDYTGPAGFRGKGSSETETRDHTFGVIGGVTATLSNYNPVKELADAIRFADSMVFTGDEGAAIDFVAQLDDDPARRGAAVAICQGTDHRYKKFSSRLVDFLAFWDADNVERLNQYGQSEWNPHPFQVRRNVRRGSTWITIREHRSQTPLTLLLPATLLVLTVPEWTHFEFRTSPPAT